MLARGTLSRAIWIYVYVNAHLYEQCGVLRGTISQVVPIDGKHAVVDTQAAVLCRQTSFQQVEDEDAVLIGSTHELDTQLLVWRPLQQHHVQTVVPHAGAGARVQRLARLGHVMVVVVVMRAVTMPLFTQHGQPEQPAGTLQSRQGVAVRDVGDVDTVYLSGRKTETGSEGQRDTMEIEGDTQCWAKVLTPLPHLFMFYSPDSLAFFMSS